MPAKAPPRIFTIVSLDLLGAVSAHWRVGREAVAMTEGESLEIERVVVWRGEPYSTSTSQWILFYENKTHLLSFREVLKGFKLYFAIIIPTTDTACSLPSHSFTGHKSMSNS